MDVLGPASGCDPQHRGGEEGNYFVLSMTGHEHLGQMYEYVVELAAGRRGVAQSAGSTPEKPELAKLIGTPATVSHETVRRRRRAISSATSRAPSAASKRGRYTTYEMALRPGIWFMTQSKDSKVFQEKSVKDVISEILKEYDIDASGS